MDIITINWCKFLTTITSDLQYRTTHYIRTSKSNEIVKSLKNSLFTIKSIYSDNEFGQAIIILQEDYTFLFNPCNPNEHVLVAERNNRTIKDRYRAMYYNLPYNRSTKNMIIYLVLSMTSKLNYFPSRFGLSKYYSPRMLLYIRNLTFKKHCKFSFGAHVQANQEPKPSDTLRARTIDCIYMRPSPAIQDVHEILHIATNKILTRRSLIELPITEDIITTTEKRA